MNRPNFTRLPVKRTSLDQADIWSWQCAECPSWTRYASSESEAMTARDRHHVEEHTFGEWDESWSY